MVSRLGGHRVCFARGILTTHIYSTGSHHCLRAEQSRDSNVIYQLINCKESRRNWMTERKGHGEVEIAPQGSTLVVVSLPVNYFVL